MAKAQTQPKALSLADLKAAAETLLAKADEAVAASKTAAEAAAVEGASDEVKAAAVKAEEDATAAVTAADQARVAYEEAQAEADAAAQAAADAAAAAQPGAPVATLDPEDDPQYVPILRDEDGERIPRNSKIRIMTTTGLNLRSLDGTLITPEPIAELNGPDVRKGDWYTVQYEAGLLAVDGYKKIR